MTTTTARPVDQWPQVRNALRESAGRVIEVLRSVTSAGRSAVGDWSIAETAAHLREVALVDAAMAARVEVPDALRPVVERAATVSMNEVAELNRLALRCEPERDTDALAQLIEAQVEGLLSATSAFSGAEKVQWLGGLTTSVAGVFAHLVTELLIHGRDIAAAEGRRFAVPADAARLFFETFLLDMLQSPEMAAFGRGRARGAGPIAWQLRLRGSPPVGFSFDGTSLRIADDTVRPDIRIAADPAVMLLVMFGRISPARAALGGGLVMWGRRPWRLGRMTRLISAV